MDQTVGDYRLIEKIGEGAAGEVFLATPTKDKEFAKTGQPVALKRYKPEILRKAHQFSRIDREFQVGSRLTHPNLVRMYEYSPGSGKESAPPYLVMEYVDGISLDRWIELFYPVPRQMLSRFTRQLIDAISELHKGGILHRDIKPQNIMVTSTFDLRVMDLGVVHVKSDLQITPEGMFIGTIRNSSPEMLFGRPSDERSDLYSLGTVFFALLHGEQVFADVKQFAQLVSKVKEERPSFNPKVRSTDEISQSLYEITQRLLAKKPEDRLGSINDVRHALEPAWANARKVEPSEPLHAYIATALTGLEPNVRDAIMFTSSMISRISKQYDLYVYEPRKATDPLLHADVDPSAVYRLDRKRVLAADVLFVVANSPSFGVGQEIEIATGCSTPTILLYREGTKISRMVTGSPANIVAEISYKTPEDLEKQLDRALAQHIAKVRTWRALVRGKAQVSLGQRLGEVRRKQGFETAPDFAETVGISGRLLEQLEQGDYQNVPLYLVDRLATKLGTTTLALLDPASVPAVNLATKSDANVRRLERTATKLGWSTTTYLDLRDDYQRQLAASGDTQTISEEQWVQRHSALEHRRLKQSTGQTGVQSPLFAEDI